MVENKIMFHLLPMYLMTCVLRISSFIFYFPVVKMSMAACKFCLWRWGWGGSGCGSVGVSVATYWENYIKDKGWDKSDISQGTTGKI